MLTEKQYQAIGMLTLHFNQIEEAIDAHLPFFIGCPEWPVALLLSSKKQHFQFKADLCKNVLDGIAEKRPSLIPAINPIRDLIAKARALADKRNDYVHSVAFMDYEANEGKLHNKKGPQKVNEKEIVVLANTAAVISCQIIQACGLLQVELINARK